MAKLHDIQTFNGLSMATSARNQSERVGLPYAHPRGRNGKESEANTQAEWIKFRGVSAHRPMTTLG
jgi:hypothetical protein